jgi:GntR family transcriptional repressor for pyruvate dehydrogenase complex
MTKATHNPAIEMFAQSFHGPMLRSLLQAQEADPQVGIEGTAEHREVVTAAKERDVAAAQIIMRQHLARTAEHLRPHM